MELIDLVAGEPGDDKLSDKNLLDSQESEWGSRIRLPGGWILLNAMDGGCGKFPRS
jgi:hypothetical protein